MAPLIILFFLCSCRRAAKDQAHLIYTDEYLFDSRRSGVVILIHPSSYETVLISEGEGEEETKEKVERFLIFSKVAHTLLFK